MKKGLWISFIAASLLTAAQAEGFKRVGSSWMGMNDIQEHAGDARHAQKTGSEQSAQGSGREESSSSTGFMGGERESEGNSSATIPTPTSFGSGAQIINPNENAQEHMQNAMGSASSHGNGMQNSQSSMGNMKPHGEDDFFGMPENAQEHMQNTMGSASSHGNGMQGQENWMNEGNHFAEGMDDANRSSHKGMNLVEWIKEEKLLDGATNDQQELPKEVHTLMHKIKQAIKFYKKEEIFEDLNITSIEDLTNPEIEQEIEKRVQRAKELREKEISQKLLEKKVARVAGEFVHYGEGQYDWVFVTKNGDVWKLDGVNENGSFAYKHLTDVKATIDKNRKVVFYPTNANDPIAKQLAGKERSGYVFAKYNDQSEKGFDWIVVVGGKPYKLEGYDEDTQSFIYTPVPDVYAKEQGDEVVILPGSNG